MRYKSLAIGLAVLATSAAAPAQSVRAGIQAWQKADYSTAAAIWRPLAEKGDADAAFNLGQAYRLGRGVAPNIGAAQTWFERAARKGHVDAQTTLGLLLFENGDQPGGLRWLKLGADKGEPRALLIYGTALFNGDHVPRNRVLGYAYVGRAAAQGLEPAKRTLAQLDALLPLEYRQKGVAVAMAEARKSPPPGSRSAKPTPKPIRAAAAAQAPASGGWRIQLGAFAQRSSAEALFRKVSGNTALAGRSPIYVPAGAVTRLQVGPFASRAAAAAACGALKGQPCFPVPAR